MQVRKTCRIHSKTFENVIKFHVLWIHNNTNRGAYCIYTWYTFAKGFQILFWCFYRWFWTSKCQLGQNLAFDSYSYGDSTLKVVFFICYWNRLYKKMDKLYCVKGVRIRSFSGPYFSAFGLLTDRYGIFLRITSEYGEIRTRKTPNTATFRLIK